MHFDGLGASEGRVTRYMPPEADEPALWHVVHDDGDEEDLEHDELRDALGLMAQRPSDGLQDCAGPYAQWLNRAADAKERLAKGVLGLPGLQAELRQLQSDSEAPMKSAGSSASRGK